MKKAVVSLSVLAAVGLAAAGGGLYWSGALADYFDPRPDRSELIREHIRTAWFKDTKNWQKESGEVEVLKCRPVRRGVVDRVRQTYPGFEIVDCTFRQKDALDNPMTQTRNFWILDGKVIYSEGMTFDKSRGRDTKANQEQYIRYVILRHEDPKAAERLKGELREAAGEPPRGRGRR
jgi:hypothetical protein